MKQFDGFLTGSNGVITPQTQADIETGFEPGTIAEGGEVNFQINRHDAFSKSISEEISKVIVESGDTPNQNDSEQLFKALNKLYAGGISVGTIDAFPRSPLPDGYIECNGATIQAATYPDLVEYLTGSPLATQATLPDYRGEFLRGWDNGRGIDTGRALSSSQLEAIGNHTHDLLSSATFSTDCRGFGSNDNAGVGQPSHSSNVSLSYYSQPHGGLPYVSNSVDGENRPRNVSVVYGIRAFGAVSNPGELSVDGLAQDIIALQGQVVTARMRVQNQQNQGVQGGTSVSGVQQRVLNTVESNDIPGATLSSNTITLPAGKYMVVIESTGHRTSSSFVELFNTTDSVVSAFGVNTMVSSGSSESTNSRAYGVFSIGGTKDFIVRQQHAALATFGFGVAVNASGRKEIYTDVIINKIG